MTDLPILLVGYGFGSSFVALFMQLGGGIYTKAADVGADLVGKVEQGIPEDDPRNPAVIADLVGDMVGDCVGSSADVFESVAAEIIGAMILGSTLAKEAGFSGSLPVKFLFFPLIVHAMDIVVSSIGVAFVGVQKTADSNPMIQLQKGYRVALLLSVVGFYIITSLLLEDPSNPGSSFKFFLCGVVGMACAYIIVLSTQYYTDYEYGPVQSIAEASTTGHGTNIIVGISVGMKATFIPTVAVAISVLTAYHLGASTGIGTTGKNAGLFGTAVATMGMLSNAVYILSMNNFGPIAGRFDRSLRIVRDLKNDLLVFVINTSNIIRNFPFLIPILIQISRTMFFLFPSFFCGIKIMLGVSPRCPCSLNTFVKLLTASMQLAMLRKQ